MHTCQLVLSRRKPEPEDTLTLQRRVFIKSFHTWPLFLCPHGVPRHHPHHRPGKRPCTVTYHVMHLATKTADSIFNFLYIAKEEICVQYFKNLLSKYHAHPSYAQQFLFVNLPNCAAQCQIS